MGGQEAGELRELRVNRRTSGDERRRFNRSRNFCFRLLSEVHGERMELGFRCDSYLSHFDG